VAIVLLADLDPTPSGAYQDHELVSELAHPLEGVRVGRADYVRLGCSGIPIDRARQTLGESA